MKFTTEEGEKFEVPIEGSLGLLALGYKGLMAMREARQKAGYDLVAEKKKQWEAEIKRHEEKIELMKEKRKVFLENKKKDKK